jgi:hypothetical protein
LKHPWSPGECGEHHRAAAEGSAQGLELCFAPDSPRGLVEFFTEAVTAG